MASSRQHQEAHGIGQIQEQLHNQAEAAEEIQGGNEADREILNASRRHDTELDELIEP